MYYTFGSVVKRLVQDILNRPDGLNVAGQFLMPPLPGRPEFALNQNDEALHQWEDLGLDGSGRLAAGLQFLDDGGEVFLHRTISSSTRLAA